MEKEIIQKEIRGITIKNLIWFLSGIVSLMIYSAIGYSNIMHAVQDGQKSDAVMQLQIDVLKADLKALQLHQTDQDIRLTRIEEQIKDKIFMTDDPSTYKYHGR